MSSLSNLHNERQRLPTRPCAGRAARTARTKLVLVAGARPNYMKIAPIHSAIERTARDIFDVDVVHTGQHYDDALSTGFFRDLDLPAPSVDLGVGSGSHATQTARVMTRFESFLEERRPHVVVVVGDVNSTAGCALATAKMPDAPGGPRRPFLVHVEAGLRSRDRRMPEEINRVVTDAVSDLCLTTCRDADENLFAEGIPAERVRCVGNPMIDSLWRCLEEAGRLGWHPGLEVEPGNYGLCTLHRASNVDRSAVLGEILESLAAVAREQPILLPLHPRTRARIVEFGLGERLAWLSPGASRTPARGLVALAPLGYREMVLLLRGARFVLTDSGGLQEETTALGIPCVTLRENTERPVTITEGTNVLAGISRAGILRGLEETLAKAGRGGRLPELWDGHAGERIVAALSELAETRR